jgi:molybdopterin molybdotransferase
MDPCVRKEASPLLTVDEACKQMLESIQPLMAHETLALKQALGRVLSHDVISPMALPSFCHSAMDGYAFSSRDVLEHQQFALKVVGTSWAGHPFEGALKQGECVRIFTGAVLPEKTDSVVMQEDVNNFNMVIELPADVGCFKHVRMMGEDVQAGQVLCRAGHLLSPIDLALLAAAGLAAVSVTRQLKIIYFSTGNELVPLGSTLKAGEIYDSNRYSLYGLLQHACFEVTDGGIIADDKDTLTDELLAASEVYDVIITTGGASVGEADYVKTVLETIGRLNFWKIAMKPGKPLTFGQIGRCYFFGLPGNPIAVMVTFERLVKQALMYLAGRAPQNPWYVQAICTTPLKKTRGRQEYLRGILWQNDDGEFFVASAGQQGSHILSSASAANCYIVLDAESLGATVNESVKVMLFSA